LKISKIPYQKTNRFNQLVVDYLDQKEELLRFVNSFPNIENFEKQIKLKKEQNIDRSLLHEVLQDQNNNLKLSDICLKNLELINKKTTFTITTGHQLNLFTGPLYFIYKIISTINLVNKLKEHYSEYDFVPIFWLASEDHDFEEINSINIYNKKIKWEKNYQGPVGKIELDNINDLISQVNELISKNENSNKIIELIEKSYLPNYNLAEATRHIINNIFGDYGLLVLDGDDVRLKSKLVDVIDKDINTNIFYDIIKKTNTDLSKNYHIQAHVRQINFFEISDKKRERITTKVDRNDIYSNPQNYSPNVLLRPIYQEMVLPNVAFIGGGAEISYWLQLKDVFNYLNMTYPILVLRNSVLILDDHQKKKIEKLDLYACDFFESVDLIYKNYLMQLDEHIDFQDDIKNLESLFLKIEEKLKDQNLISSLRALNKKTLNSFNDFEKKVIKNLKFKKDNDIAKIKKLSDMLFPNNQLQERNENFISMYIKFGDNFIKNLFSSLDPLDPNFVILELESE